MDNRLIVYFLVTPSYSNTLLAAVIQADAVATTEKDQPPTERPEGTYPYPDCSFEYYTEGNVPFH